MRIAALCAGFVLVVSPVASHAFDIKGVKIDVGDQCLEKAMTLASSAGVGMLTAYDQYVKNSSITAVELGIGAAAFKNMQDYVSSGCARSHLESALAKVQQ